MDFIKPLLLTEGLKFLKKVCNCNYDKESFLLLEFLSAVFSLLVIILQTNSSLCFSLLPKFKSWRNGKSQ